LKIEKNKMAAIFHGLTRFYTGSGIGNFDHHKIGYNTKLLPLCSYLSVKYGANQPSSFCLNMVQSTTLRRYIS